MSLQNLARQVAAQGRGNDTQLVHMSTQEVAGLQALAAQHGMRLPRNPKTGLIEANFLDSILPAIAGIGLMAFAPELAPFIGDSAAGFLGTSTGAGLAVGAADTLATGSLKKGLSAGLGAYGGAELGGALSAAAPAAPTATAISAAPTVGATNIPNYALLPDNIDMGGGFNPFTGSSAIPVTNDSSLAYAMGNPSDIATLPAPASSIPTASPDAYNPAITNPTDARLAAGTQLPPGGPVAPPTTLSNMGSGLSNLTNSSGRSAFMSALGSSGPFSTPGYNQMFKAGAVLAPTIMDTPTYAPSSSQTDLQNAVRPWTLIQTPGIGMGTSGGTAINYQWTPGQPYNALTGKTMAGGGLSTGATPGEGLHRTVSQLHGVEHLMKFSGGGISDLGGYSDGGQLLRGPGDGVSDSIPARIGQHQPARLAEGEFVVPARIVSELGNGSTNAGAKQLYAMIDRIQNDRRRTLGSKHAYANDTQAARALPA